jgi:hypothetical protein
MFSVHRVIACVAAVTAFALAAPAANAAWSVSSYGAPANPSQAAGTSCVTLSFCVTVGFQSGVASRGLAVKWNGAAFSTPATASTTTELYGVSCNTTTFCMGVGGNYSGAGIPAAQTYNGTTWSNTTTVTPAGSTFSELAEVSCPSTTLCYAVGWVTTATATTPIVEQYSAGTWTQQTVTLPAGGTAGKLLDVSCTSTTACTAVGHYDATANPRRTLVYRWNGTSWSVQSSANPASHTGSELQGVSCTSSTNCVAVGNYTDSLSVQHALSETWNGALWSLKTVADPASATDPILYDVSCWTSPSFGCEGVGGYNGATNIEPYAANYNGTTWSLQSVPKAAGINDAVLAGVSCPTTCQAVGASALGANIRPAIDFGP